VPTQTPPPPEIKKFLPYPSEKTQRSKDADAHNPSETAFQHPSEILVHRGVCILNGMALKRSLVKNIYLDELSTASLQSSIERQLSTQIHI
jgi:hypothetical protein